MDIGTVRRSTASFAYDIGQPYAPEPDCVDHWARRIADRGRTQVLVYVRTSILAASQALAIFGVLSSASCSRLSTSASPSTIASPPRKANVGDVRTAQRIDLSSTIGPILDQQETAATVGCALVYAINNARGTSEPPLSWWGIYMAGRANESSDSDNDLAGITVIDALEALVSTGAYSEVAWPPTSSSPAAGSRATVRISGWKRVHVNDSLELIAHLRMGRVVLLGVPVWREFLAAGNIGVVAVPPTFEPMGYSAIVLVGFDEGSRVFTFASTWGNEWGDRGFGRIQDLDLTRIAAQGFVLDP